MRMVIYNRNLALVNQEFTRYLHQGLNEMFFTEFPNQLEPDSVVLEGPEDVLVLEQGHRRETVSQEMLETDMDYEKVDAQTVAFWLKVPPESESELNYRVRLRW